MLKVCMKPLEDYCVMGSKTSSDSSGEEGRRQEKEEEWEGGQGEGEGLQRLGVGSKENVFKMWS